MGCCGCHQKRVIVSEDEKLKRLRAYQNSFQAKCSFCSGTLRRYPNGEVICTRCRRRKT